MSLGDLLRGSFAPADDLDPDDLGLDTNVAPDLTSSRLERKSLAPAPPAVRLAGPYPAPAPWKPRPQRQQPATDDFGADDEIISPRSAPSARDVSFGADDEKVPAIPLPRSKPRDIPKPPPKSFDPFGVDKGMTPRADLGPSIPDEKINVGQQPAPTIAPTAAPGPGFDLEAEQAGVPVGIRQGMGLREPQRPAEPGEIAALDDAPFRTGGAVLDKTLGTTTGMLSGAEAYDQQQTSIREAEQRVEKARARKAEVDRAWAEISGTADLTRPEDAVALRAQRERLGVGRAKAEFEGAEKALAAAKKAPLPTQTGWRDTMERAPGIAASQITSTARGGARGITGAVEVGDYFVSKALGTKPNSETFRQVDKALDEAADGINTAVGQRLFRADTAQDDRFGSKLVNGLVSTGVFAAGGAAGKAVGLSPWLTTSILGALPQAEQQFKQAERAADITPGYARAWMEANGLKVDDATANGIVKWAMFGMGLGIGASEAVPIAHLFERLEKASGGGLTRWAGIVAAQSGEEGLQEAFQQLAENAATRGLLDPNRELTKDVAEGFLVGALSGAMVTGVMAAPAVLAPQVQQAQASLPQNGPEAQAVLRGMLTPPPRARPNEPPPADGSATEPVAPPATSTPLPETPPENAPGNAPPDLAQIPEAGVLQAYGYNSAQIADMSPEQRQAEYEDAIAAGVKPEEGRSPPENAPNTPEQVVAPPPPPPEQPGNLASAPSAERRAELERLIKMAEAQAPTMELNAQDPHHPQETRDHYAGQAKSLRDAIARYRAELGTRPPVDADVTSAFDDIFGAEDAVAGTRNAPVELNTAHDIEVATAAMNTDHTSPQGEANNIQRAHATWRGRPITIEVGPGGVRRGVTNGTHWEQSFTEAYGYFRGITGKDGDAVDVHIGPNLATAPNAYVLNELDRKTGAFKQTKTFIGFKTEADARAAYLGTQGKSEKMIGGIASMPVAEFDTWLTSHDHAKPAKMPKVAAPKPAPRAKGALSFLQFLASEGGLRPDGDLKSLGIPKRIVIPGLGFRSLIRGEGMTLDQAREKAVEAGYLQDIGHISDAQATSTLNDVLELISNEVGGKRTFAQGEELTGKDEADRRRQDHAEDQLAPYRDEVRAAIEEAGERPGTFRDEDIARAAEIMLAEGLPAEDALERAIMRARVDDGLVEDEKISEFYGEDALDVHPAAAHEDGAAPPREGAVVQEPGRDDEGGGGVPGAVTDVAAVGQEDEVAAEDRGDQHAAEAPGDRAPVQGNEGRPDQSGEAEGAVEPGADNKPQLTIPGTSKISGAEQAQRNADKPLKPKVAQKPMDSGLFGDESQQTDLVDMARKPPSKPVEKIDTTTKAPETGPSDSDLPAGYKITERIRKVKGGGEETAHALYQDGAYLGVFRSREAALREIAKRPASKAPAADVRGAPAVDDDVKAAFDDIFAEEKPAASKPGPLSDMMKRIENAYTDFAASLVEQHGLDADTARDLTNFYVRKKFAKVDPGIGRITVKHGGFLNDDAVQRAVVLMKEDAAKQAQRATKRTKTALASSAAKGVGRGTSKALQGLSELFNPKGKLTVGGISFDAETYAKARPMFIDAAREFGQAWKDIREFAKLLVDELKANHGFDTPALMRMRPYLEAFTQEVKTGKVDLGKTEAAKDERSLSDRFAEVLRGDGFKTIVQARQMARLEPNVESAKAIDEAMELAVVTVAREIVQGEGTPQEKFNALVALYGKQPKLSTRTSTQMRDQAYSTPIPLAYVASRLAGIDADTTVLEPTAGNGALLIEAAPKKSFVNEINPQRRANLETMGFHPSGKDASEKGLATGINNVETGVDVVIANPPFGAVQEGGDSKVFDLSDIQPGYQTREIDHVIALRSLAAMHGKGGRAVLIIGGLNKLLQSPEARADGYNGKSKREFFKVLFDRYNVVDHFTVAGELYERQGAGWPVDVIVISGRGKSARPLPSIQAPRILSSWDALAETLNGRPGQDRKPAGQPAEGPSAGGSPAGNAGVREPAQRPPQQPTKPSEPGDLGGRPHVGPGGAEAGGKRDDQSGGGGKPAGSHPPNAPERRPPRVEQETEQQVSYTPQSKGGYGLGTLVPVNMRTSIADALAAVEAKHGDIDDYVASQLGYSKNELPAYFAQEQIDALALAIDNLERGAGFIIGDQTGIGKGRVNAAIIRWAIKNGRVPVFVTEKPNLYADMYRDLNDIGIQGLLGREPSILATNSDLKLPLSEDGKVAISNSPSRHNALLDTLANGNDASPEPVGMPTKGPKLDGDRYLTASKVLQLAKTNDIVAQVLRAMKVALNADATPERAFNDAARPVFSQLISIVSDPSLFNQMPTGVEFANAAARFENAATAPATPAAPRKTLADYDMVFTNYSQMQTVKGDDTARRRFLTAIAPNAVVILDESHNAGGQAAAKGTQNRAGYVRALVSAANGVFYSSATYAKRPDVMDLYSATDMGLAVDKPEQLAQAIIRGGVPMQQVVASMLAKAGQYIRRERSFAGVTYDTPVVSVDHEQYDGISGALASIQHFSEARRPAVAQIHHIIRTEAAAISHDGSTGGAGASSTNFTAVMHNLINQMLLSLKVEPAAAMAIEALKKGQKPVITVANTMESFLNDFAAEMGIAPGGEIDGDFSQVLKKYLDRTRTITIKKPFSKEKGRRHYLTDEELGPVGRAAYAAALRKIESLDLSNLSLSPIDRLKSRLEAAGYKVGEITGRGSIIDYSGGAPVLKSRAQGERSIQGRRKTITQFNNGDLDVIVLNQAGSTGISLHASEKFKDQRQRHMIIAQPEANIDTHMQMLGRVHRTGQVVLPTFSQIIADIPAEKRPAAVLAKKMASLNASTTASRGGALTSKDVPDFINVYGDIVAVTYLADEPQMSGRLGNPVSYNETGGLQAEDAMRKMTGRIPLLPLKEQEALYEHLEAEYDALLKQMEAAGENALEAKTLDLQARTLASAEVVEARDNSGSPFAAPVTVEQVSMRRLGKPFKPEEIAKRILDAEADLDGTPHFLSEGLTAENTAERLAELAAVQVDDSAPIAQFETYKRSIIDEIEEPPRQEEERVRLDAIKDRWKATSQMLPPAGRVTLKTSNGNLTAIVLHTEVKGKAKNPLAMSTWKTTFAIADAGRQITIPWSRLHEDGKAPQDDQVAIEVAPVQDWIESYQQTLDRFTSMQSDSRETRYIATGNLLAAYEWLRSKGRIINYSDDSGAVRQGILTARDFDFAKQARETGKALRTVEEVQAWLVANPNKKLFTDDRHVSLTFSPNRGDVTISVNRARNVGGMFFLDRPLLQITGDFTLRNGAMTVTTNAIRQRDAIARLQQLGAKFSEPGKPPEMKPAKDAGPASGTMASVARVGLTPKAQQRQADLEQVVTGIIRRVTGTGTTVRFADELGDASQEGWGGFGEGKQRQGLYTKADRIIQIALSGLDPTSTAYHEAYHDLESRLMTPRELAMMERETDRLRGIVQSRYGLSDADLTGIKGYEIRAMAFEAYVEQREQGNRPRGFLPAVVRVFERMMQMFREIRNALAGMGFDSAESLFGRAYEGQMAGRPSRWVEDAGPASMAAMTPRRVARPGHVGPLPTPMIGMPPETVADAMADPTRTYREKLGDALNALLLRPARHLWDKQIDIARLEQMAERMNGAPVAERFATYQAAKLFPGRAGERIKEAGYKLFRPVYDEMKARNVTPGQLHEFLYARHAIERNAQIRTIDPANDAGSGITDADAAAILSRVAPRRSDFDAVARHVDAIIKHNRDLMLREGLEDAHTLLQWQQAYQHYVPLKGFEAGPDDEFGTPSRGKGFDVRRPESMRALGRSDRAADILTNILDQTQRTIIRSEKNRVAKTFLRFAQGNPSPLYKFGLAEMKRRVNPATGLVETTWVTHDAKADDVFAAKINGKTYYMVVHHEGLASALKNLDANKINGFLRVWMAMTRQWAAMQTARNPDFIFGSNLWRDLQDAGIALTAEQKKGFHTRFLANIGNGRALFGATMGVATEGQGTDRFTALYNEWRMEGGKISVFGYKDLETIRREVDREMKRRLESMTKKVIMTPLRTINPFGGHLAKLLEAMADVTESMTRLAVYAAGRDIGLTKAQAAAAARAMTVDFNMKGYGTLIPALYAFAQPSINGSVNLMRRIRKHPGRMSALLIGGVGTMSVMLTLWNLMMSGHDDDEEKKTRYEKLPQHEKDKHFHIYWPGAKHPFKLSKGFFLVPFASMGENAAMAFMGKKTATAAAHDFLGATASAFNPFGGEGSIFSWRTWLGMALPTVLDPVGELTTNRNFAGKPIHPDEMPWNKGTPHSQQSHVTTSPHAVAAAEALNRITGGNTFKKGTVDVYPGDLEYLWNFVLGGYGKFMNNNAELAQNKAAGIDTPVEKIPILRRFIGTDTGSVYAVRRDYYENSREAGETVAAVRKAVTAERLGQDVEDASKTIRELAPKAGMERSIDPNTGTPRTRNGQPTYRYLAESIYRDANHELQELRLEERRIRNDPSISRADRGRLLDANHAVQLDIMKNANKDYRRMQPATP